MVQKKLAAAKGKTPVKPKQIKQEEEEEVKEVAAIAKGKRASTAAAASKTNKTPVKAVKPAQEEEEDDDESDETDDDDAEDGESSEIISDDDDEDDDDEEDEEAEEDSENETEPGEVSLRSTGTLSKDDDDSDEEEDENDEDDEEEEDDGDDEAPEEISIGKSPKKAEASEAATATNPLPKKGGIPHITTGNISPKTPADQIIRVENLPEKFQHIELVEVFAKFGTIQTISRMKIQGKNRSTFIAFASADGAKAALAASDVTLNGNVLQITKLEKIDGKERDLRTVVISCLGPNCTVEQLKEHFADCGTIEEATLSRNRICPYGFVRFESVESVAEALKLNNSTLNDRVLSIRSKSQTADKNAERTIVIANTSEAEYYSSEGISKIFINCGEIADVEVLCTKSTLAFVTFKTDEGAQKAFELNGKTVGGLELKLSQYQTSSNRTIVVTNLAFGVTEESLTEVFAKAGELEHVKVCGTFALVKFKNNDGFCKSFLLNETFISGRPVFLEPNSTLKQKWSSRHNNHHNKFQGRRPGGPHNNSFNNKRPGGPQGGGQFNANKNFNQNKRPGGHGGPGGPGGKKNFNNNKRPGGKRPNDNDSNVPHFFKRTKSD